MSLERRRLSPDPVLSSRWRDEGTAVATHPTPASLPPSAGEAIACDPSWRCPSEMAWPASWTWQIRSSGCSQVGRMATHLRYAALRFLWCSGRFLRARMQTNGGRRPTRQPMDLVAIRNVLDGLPRLQKCDKSEPHCLLQVGRVKRGLSIVHPQSGRRPYAMRKRTVGIRPRTSLVHRCCCSALPIVRRTPSGTSCMRSHAHVFERILLCS